MLTSFKYLGRVISAAENYWPEIVTNLDKVSGATVADADSQKVGGGAAGIRILFKVVVQSVLIFGAETWVVTPHMGRVLGGFQDQVARRLKGRLLRRRHDVKLE